jgi:anti-sigma B factor antagonist
MPSSELSDVGLFFRTAKRDGRIFMYFDGEVDQSNVVRLRKRLFQAIGRGCEQIVVDLQHLEFISSVGLGALVEAARLQRTTDGSLLFRSLRPQLRQLLDLTGLAELFEPFPSTA